jgi:hypothetical protein
VSNNGTEPHNWNYFGDFSVGTHQFRLYILPLSSYIDFSITIVKGTNNLELTQSRALVYGSNQLVPIYRYESATLDNVVNITAGKAYWIGITGLSGGTLFIDNSSDNTQPYTAFYSPPDSRYTSPYVLQNLIDYTNRTYYNYTATIFLTQKVIAMIVE